MSEETMPTVCKICGATNLSIGSIQSDVGVAWEITSIMKQCRNNHSVTLTDNLDGTPIKEIWRDENGNIVDAPPQADAPEAQP